MRALGISLWVGLLTGSVLAAAQSRPDPQARRLEALALEQQGKNQEAEARWREILKVQPRNPEPTAHLGLLEARQGHYKEAVPYYRKALAIKPDVPGLRLNLGLALFKAGELRAAIPEFETVRRGLPDGSQEAQRTTILIGMAYYGLA